MDIASSHVAAGRIVFDAEGLPNVCGVLARTQTAGRGQRGRTWRDVPGESLCATCYLRPPSAAPERAGETAFVAGCAVALALEAQIQRTLLPERRPRIGLKWPNDILLDGKKAGGILVEMANTPDGGAVALVGLGLNLLTRDFPPELADSATSLAREGVGGKTPREWAEAFYFEMQAAAKRCASEGLVALLEIWNRYDGTTGRRYETEWDDAVLQGAAVGIDAVGRLRLRLEDGREIAVLSASRLREIF